jgi:hypothetical protein
MIVEIMMMKTGYLCWGEYWIADGSTISRVRNESAEMDGGLEICPEIEGIKAFSHTLILIESGTFFSI